jgi:hypothetical protein
VAPAPRTVRLSRALYPLAAIQKACDAFGDLCAVQIQHSDEELTVSILPLEASPNETTDEFLNYALCAALETHLTGSQTSEGSGR